MVQGHRFRAPEALYWAGVSKYKASGDASALGETARQFKAKYPDSICKERRNLIVREVESDLHAYLSGILKNLGSPCIEVNGTANHLHVLFLQRPTGGVARKKRGLCRRLYSVNPSGFTAGFLHPWLWVHRFVRVAVIGFSFWLWLRHCRHLAVFGFSERLNF